MITQDTEAAASGRDAGAPLDTDHGRASVVTGGEKDSKEHLSASSTFSVVDSDLLVEFGSGRTEWPNECRSQACTLQVPLTDQPADKFGRQATRSQTNTKREDSANKSAN